MARFEFQLEPLLKHRQMIEDEAQRALAMGMRERMILENELRRHQETIRDDKQLMGQALVGRVDVPRIRTHAIHVAQVAVRAQQIGFRMVELNRRIEKARVELVEAMKQRKAVELLKDKQFRRWRHEQDRRETAQLDELATQGHVRRMNSGEAA
ncbi:MAG: flagellar export protein FliJ [Phycisphaerales bacterium]